MQHHYNNRQLHTQSVPSKLRKRLKKEMSRTIRELKQVESYLHQMRARARKERHLLHDSSRISVHRFASRLNSIQETFRDDVIDGLKLIQKQEIEFYHYLGKAYETLSNDLKEVLHI